MVLFILYLHRQGLLVYYTPTHSLYERAKTSDMCTHIFKKNKKKRMEVGGVLFYQTEDKHYFTKIINFYIAEKTYTS